MYVTKYLFIILCILYAYVCVYMCMPSVHRCEKEAIPCNQSHGVGAGKQIWVL